MIAISSPVVAQRRSRSQMSYRRRTVVASLLGPIGLASAFLSAKQDDPLQEMPPRRSPFPRPDEDTRLPNGKSQKDAIAKQQHEEALKDAQNLISTAQQLKEELEKAGNYVVPMSSVKKTEDIEKLAKRIRGRLKNQ
jgi:hypothetical protein